MTTSVVRLIDMPLRQLGWTDQELAAFFLLKIRLRGHGLSFETDHGMSDEGEPWLVLHDSDTGEVFAHFARTSGSYVVCAPRIKGSLSGPDLYELVKRFVNLCRYRQGTAPH